MRSETEGPRFGDGMEALDLRQILGNRAANWAIRRGLALGEGLQLEPLPCRGVGSGLPGGARVTPGPKSLLQGPGHSNG